MEIQIKSVQTIDKKQETMIQTGIANIETHPKGTILTWQIPEENQTGRMTILENKIILKKPNQIILFEQEKETKSSLKTPYGEIIMNIKTTHMEITKQKEEIQSIILRYEIKLENTNPYQNQIEIEIH